MSTMEHLIMQIFDRKNWIEGQLKHQLESYEEYLAYNFLSEGKQPPSWLWAGRCGHFDHEELNRQQLIPGTLFPLRWTTTPSVNNSSYFTMAALKGDKVSQAKYDFSECSDKAVPGASKLNPDMMEDYELIEKTSAEFDPLERIRNSNPWLRDPEILSRENEIGFSHHGEKKTDEEQNGRLSQSKASALTADNVRKSSSLKTSLYYPDGYDGRVKRSRSHSTSKTDCLEKSLGPLKPVKCIENELDKVAESERDSSALAFPFAPLNRLACAMTDNDMVTHTCISGSSSVEVGNAGNVKEYLTKNYSLHHQNEDVKGTLARSRLEAQQIGSLSESAEPLKHLNYFEDGVNNVEESQTEIPPVLPGNLNQPTCITTENLKIMQPCVTGGSLLGTSSPVVSNLKMSCAAAPVPLDITPSIEPKKLLFDAIEVYDLNMDSGISSEKKKQCSYELALSNLESVRSLNKDSRCREHEVNITKKEVFQNRLVEDSTGPNCGTEQERLELLEGENLESHPYSASGDECYQQDVHKRRSLESVTQERQSNKLSDETGFLVGPEYPAHENCEISGLIANYFSLEKETNKSSSGVAFKKLKTLESATESLSSSSIEAYLSPIKQQHQNEALPTADLMIESEEVNIVSPQILEEKLELSEAQESESLYLIRSNHKDTLRPASPHLNISSLRSEGGSACSTADVDCAFNSDLIFSGDQVVMPNSSKESSPRTSLQYPVEEKYSERIIEEKCGKSIQVMENVDDAVSPLTSPISEMILKSETAALGDVNSLFQPKVLPLSAGTDNAMLDSHRLRNSASNDISISGSSKSDSYALAANVFALCSSAQAMASGSSMGTEVFSFEKTARNSKTHSSKRKVSYSLRSSTKLSESISSLQPYHSASICQKNPRRPETTNKIDAYPEDFTETSVDHKWITPHSTETQGAQARSRYCLRSLSSRDKNVSSIRSNRKTYVSQCEISWPKRRKVGYKSNNILATSPRLRFNNLRLIQEKTNHSFKMETSSEVEVQPVPFSTEAETPIVNTDPQSSFEFQCQRKKINTVEDCACIKENWRTAQDEHADNELCGVADKKLGIRLGTETKVSETTIQKCQNPYNLNNFHDSELVRTINPSIHGEFCNDRELCDTFMGSHMNVATSFGGRKNRSIGFDEAMPEFEGFRISLCSAVEDDTISRGSSLPILEKEQRFAIDHLRILRNALSPASCIPKYKVNNVSDLCHSLPIRLMEHMNLSSNHFLDVDMKQSSESDNGSISGTYGNSGLEPDVSIVGHSFSYSLPASNFNPNLDSRKLSLSPPIMKFGQKLVSRRSGASSENVCSNPELICFRIDENSSIDDENTHINGLDDSKEDIFLTERKEFTNRKAHADMTAEYQNRPSSVSKSKKFTDRCSLESINSASYFMTQMSAPMSPAKEDAGKQGSKLKTKENTIRRVNRSVRKPALSLRNRSIKSHVSGKLNERSRSHGNLQRGCKPTNVVSNISSFVPLVRQKQQAATPIKGRIDIKIKALEAAEAAKRLEEKKHNERELRKAAFKREREKLEQENIKQLEIKRKQEGRKKETEIAARKRQREEEGRKEKERKRRCTEETRRQKKDHDGQFRAGKEEMEDEKKQKKEDQRGETKERPESENGGDYVEHQKVVGTRTSIPKVLPEDDRNEKMDTRPNSLQEVIKTNESENVQSYDMSPYIDSDDEDGGEIRRERKFIPLWARRGCIEQILISNQHLDPTKIFCRNHSFSLSEVLPATIPQRPL